MVANVGDIWGILKTLQSTKRPYRTHALPHDGLGDDERVYGDFKNDHIKIEQDSIPWGKNALYDHQGHIIPQNLIRTLLDSIYYEMAVVRDFWITVENKKWEHEDVLVCIQRLWDDSGLEHFKPLRECCWADTANPMGSKVISGEFMNTLNNYKANHMNQNFMYGLFQNVFSLIIWNPGNICRAPSDDKRNGVPGNTIDEEVIEHLMAENSISSAHLKKACDHIKTRSTSEFLKTWKCIQGDYVNNKVGYFKFPWKHFILNQHTVMLRPSKAERWRLGIY